MVIALALLVVVAVMLRRRILVFVTRFVVKPMYQAWKGGRGGRGGRGRRFFEQQTYEEVIDLDERDV